MSKIGNHRVRLQEHPLYQAAHLLREQFDCLMSQAKSVHDLDAIKLGWDDAKAEVKGNVE